MDENLDKKIIIVMPAYNVAKTLFKTVQEVPEIYRSNIILVDNACNGMASLLCQTLDGFAHLPVSYQ